MNITFEKDEIESLPESMRKTLNGSNEFEGDPKDIFPDVAGLTTARDKEKKARVEANKTLDSIAEKFGAERKDIVTAIDDHLKANGSMKAAKRELADANMKIAIADAKGNVAALPANVKDRMTWSDELGQYIVEAEDGKPLKNDDGTLKSVSDVVADMRKDKAFGALFKASEQSGSGSDPSHSGDAPGKPPSGTTEKDGLPSLQTRRSQMTIEDKVAIANSDEDFERWPL